MPTVLIVEDDPNQRLLYREELAYEGYDVLEAPGGQEAIAMVQAGGIDVVVLDIAMPGTDGIETLSRILAIDNKIPVILNTAYSSYKDDFMTWAADAYVVKSSDLSALKQQIATVLAKRGIEPATPSEPES
ncbi:MAG: response regulator [candidate division WS1 bacterium]|jgi:CheY-like chemotaxis protein|nr:response regulator [candidate division WS1 bacterium]